MRKFIAIEGLRGWLAWTVVLSHLAQTSGIGPNGLGPALLRLGHCAVFTFMIISGFVITHMIAARPEPYGPYLLRRFMRIFPLFAVTCAIGYVTNDIHARTLSEVAWAADPDFANTVANYANIAQSNHEFFWAHAIAHLTMLHGVISETLLPYSQYAFNSPAWSLSLEWQFYLIAPFAIMLAARPRIIVWVALAIAALEIAYKFGLLGNFSLPSFLPGAAGYFAVGIASRQILPMIRTTIRQPGPIWALLIVLVPLGWAVLPIVIWAVVLTRLVVAPSRAGTPSFMRIQQIAMESRIATYFGSRSYSIYLCHLPIIAVCHALWLGMFPHAQQIPTFFGVSAMAVPLTIIAAELLYRGVERPGIALGSRLARRRAAVAAAT
jgi:peptidoglycan/LPS O-acetylase OafA/YrhL